MNEIILNYIVQAILGGASGYITNDYALNMLFKEYTPLKIGGVIKKTRSEFVENLSSMVENDIINKEKLREILCNENFKKEFKNLTADFYENCLYEAVATDTFANIDGFESTIKSTDSFVEKKINEHMPDLYNLIAANFDAGDFLSSDSLYTLIIDIFDNSNIIENILTSIYKNNDKLKVDCILGKEVIETIINNCVEIFAKAVSESSDSELIKTLETVNFEKALNSAKEILYKRKFKEIVNLNSDTLRNINTVILSYINSKNGTDYINSLIRSLFSYGTKINKSIFQLLDNNFEEHLKNYLIKNIPDLTENIVYWIKENDHLIDYLIEESIDEVISESDGLKAKLLSTIKNTFYSTFSKKYSIVDKIISYVRKISEPEKLSRIIIDKLINLLNDLTVGEIVAEAEKNHITPEKIGNLIITYATNNSEALINTLADYISEIEIQRILPDKLVDDELLTTIVKKLRELISYNSSKKYLANKATMYAEHLLSKEFGMLINEEKAEVLTLEIKNILKRTICSNEKSIKIRIESQVATAARSFASKELSLNSTKYINEELYKNYSMLTDELKNINLATALDKLNSIENIANNSSESLRAYAANNTDIILSGSIKAVVTDNLNKLDDDELVDLANDFIGRELKPIMYFGGVLGLTAGLILAAFQSSPLKPAEVNIANMIVYALVGFVTNVVAINMIFKPYKEKKFLSKIPFLRNFSLGYIIKNQKTFAVTTAHFIDKSLLSKKSINELFDKYKDKIKNSFTNNIADNNYQTLSSLLKNNKHNVIKGVFLFIKNKVSSNINKIGGYLYSKLKNIKVSSLLTEKNLVQMSSALTEKLINSDLSGNVYSSLHSDNALNSKFSGIPFKSYILHTNENYYDKLNITLSDENELKNFIIKYEHKYESLASKHLNEIINHEKQEKFAQQTADKISSIVLSKNSRDKITQNILNITKKYVDKNTTFKEIFNGKLKYYVDSHMPSILEKISENVKKIIVESKSTISVNVQSEIKDNLGFIEKGMFNLMGGDEIIDELLTKIITVKIPKFMDYKKQELNHIASNLLEEKLYNAKVEILFTGLNKLQINELIDNYLNPANSLKIEHKINNLTRNLFIKTGEIRLTSVLTLFNINGLNSFFNVYDNEINAITNELSFALKHNKVQIIDKVNGFTNSLIDEFANAKFKDVFKGIAQENVKRVIDNTIVNLNENHIDEIIYSALKNSKIFMKDIKVFELIDKIKFEKSVENHLITLLNDKVFENTVKTHLEAIIDEAVSFNFNFVDDKTKRYVLNIFVDSIINGLKRNLDEILKAVEFDKIALEEIEKMEPKKIHEMFNSFGGKYFKRLMLYGYGGFVFGINMYVGFTLTLLKILSELFNKKDK